MKIFKSKKWEGFRCRCEHYENNHRKVGDFIGSCCKCNCERFRHESAYAKDGKCNNSGKKCYACPLMICYLVRDHKGEHSYTLA